MVNKFRVGAIIVNSTNLYGGTFKGPIGTIEDIVVHGYHTGIMVGDHTVDTGSEFKFSANALPDKLRAELSDIIGKIELYLEECNS